MSDRIGEQILVESYKVLYDYIAMNESEDTKFDLQIKTFKKIEKAIDDEINSKRRLINKLAYSKEKLEEPIAALRNMDELWRFYIKNENDALELLKMISSNDTDGIKDGGYARTKGAYLLNSVDDLGTTLAFYIYSLLVIDDKLLGDDKYKKFILKAFPVWVKSAKRLLSAVNKYK